MDTKLPSQDGILVGETTVDDIAEIVRHRGAMFDHMDVRDSASLDRMVSAAGPYLQATIAEDSYRGWFAMTAPNQVAGGVGILLQSSPPRPWEVRSRRAYLLNLYVYPEHRRQGIARLLIEAGVGWCRREGFVTVSLHASELGRPLYQSLGFAPTNEMRLRRQVGFASVLGLSSASNSAGFGAPGKLRRLKSARPGARASRTEARSEGC